jgi:thymidine kinase
MSLPFKASIDIIFGPMFSGKSTETIRRLIIYHEMEMKVLFVNNKLDTRTDYCFSTHNKTISNKLPFDSVKVANLKEVDFQKYDVIGIDESQFFEGLKKTVVDWVEYYGKIVIVAGLNGDAERRPFGEINDLIPYANTITKLSPFCVPCKKYNNNISEAIFTKKIINKDTDSNILIGGKEYYTPVCRKCYLDS